MNSNFCLLFLCSVFLFTTSPASETSKGFTIDLIHRSSLQSPPSQPRWTHIANAIRRSTARVDRFKLSKAPKTDVQSSLMPAGGEYMMNFSMGTPPVPIVGIADTGSDLIWTQCKPCVECYKQKPPMFDPSRSSSYRNLSCQSNACHTIPSTNCDFGNTCSYSYSYGDRSYTAGELATDALSLGTSTFPNVVFGCGHDNGGTFNENGSGLIGLGGGSLSLVSQLSQPLGSRFAYCLVPLNNASKTSKISFGDKAVISGGPGVVSTPLVRKDPDTFYYLTLQSVRIGDHNLEYKSNPFNSGEYYGIGGNEGNIIIDSGTTLSFLPEEFYSELEAAVKAAVEGVEQDDDPEGILSLCYRGKGELRLPGIRVRFEGGEVEVKASNAFVRMGEDLVCLGVKGASDVAIFGNLWQMGMMVSYDLQQGKVTFKPMNCSEHV